MALPPPILSPGSIGIKQNVANGMNCGVNGQNRGANDSRMILTGLFDVSVLCSKAPAEWGLIDASKAERESSGNRVIL